MTSIATAPSTLMMIAPGTAPAPGGGVRVPPGGGRPARPGQHGITASAGDVVWNGAGSGVLTRTLPGPVLREQGGTIEAVSLWINLPASGLSDSNTLEVSGALNGVQGAAPPRVGPGRPRPAPSVDGAGPPAAADTSPPSRWTRAA